MGKFSWLAVSLLALVLLTAAYGIGGFLLAGVILGVPYAIGCRLHPRTRHGACNGTGTHRSPLYPWSERRCRGCVGGRQIRHGARVLGMPYAKTEHQRTSAAIEKRRKDRAWR